MFLLMSYETEASAMINGMALLETVNFGNK